VTACGGISYTEAKMQQFKGEALAVLEAFPQSDIKSGFIQLVNYVTDRKY
jgi:octaprenyl-diphosphate synthase